MLHNQFLRTKVPHGFETYGSYVVPINYEGASIAQVSALADASSQCTQYVKLECRGVSMWSKSQVRCRKCIFKVILLRTLQALQKVQFHITHVFVFFKLFDAARNALGAIGTK